MQAALTPLGYPSVFDSPAFAFNEYTSTAWFGIGMSLINIALLLFVFKEHCLDSNRRPAIQTTTKTGNINEGNGVCFLSTCAVVLLNVLHVLCQVRIPMLWRLSCPSIKLPLFLAYSSSLSFSSFFPFLKREYYFHRLFQRPQIMFCDALWDHFVALPPKVHD